MKSYFKLTGVIALFWFVFFTAQQVILLAFTYSHLANCPFHSGGFFLCLCL